MEKVNIEELWGSFSEEEKDELQEETAMMIKHNVDLGRENGTIVSTLQHNNKFYKAETHFESDGMDFKSFIEFYELSGDEYKIAVGLMSKHEDSFVLPK